MKKIIVTLGCLAACLPACSTDGGTGATAQANTVVLDVRCSADADCPSGFECETEEEHGAAASYCVAHHDDDSAAGQCPAGYELEVEHAETFCKPHGGGHDGSGGDDDGGTSGGSQAGSACATDADCASGLECEVEVEGGVTTATCKPHGG